MSPCRDHGVRYATLLLSNISTTLYRHPMFSELYIVSMILKMARAAKEQVVRSRFAVTALCLRMSL